MARAIPSSRHLDAGKVIKTIETLYRRVEERFPGAGLVTVCGDLLELARQNSARAAHISRSNVPLRVGVLLLLGVAVAALVAVLSVLRSVPAAADSIYSVLQGIEAAANLTVLTGAAMFFLIRSEERSKRQRALAALHELRSLIHVIDMHQLTKDPSTIASVTGSTASSPKRTLTPYELARYLDYCSEMVSLTSKLAVLFAQSFPDPIVTEAVSDLDRVAAGLSQKIWQKIMIIGTLGDKAQAHADPAAMQPAAIAQRAADHPATALQPATAQPESPARPKT